MASQADIRTHYDAHDEVFLRVLDPTYLAYSAGHWAAAPDLVAAQTAKFDYIARKIDLNARRRILEVGCGWGSFAQYCAARHPEIKIVGLTLSATQRTHVAGLGLRNLTVVESDWRDFHDDAPFDAIVAIESLEHFASMEDRSANRHVDVYRAFFETAHRLSTPDAPLYVQSSIARAGPDDLQGFLDARFILGKVFPGSALATVSSLQLAAHGSYEVTELLLRGPEMIRTLHAWRSRLYAAREAIETRHGQETFQFFDRYFEASIRRFEKGHVDLLEATFARQRLL